MPCKVVFSKKYSVKLPGHAFKAGKFEEALRTLLKKNIIGRADVVEPPRPSREDLLLAHAPAWVDRLLGNRLTREDMERAEMDAGPEAVEGHIINVGGTLLAARHALETGLGVNCGGGAHHAFADRGEGFCLLNDIAVAIRKLQREKRIKKALVIDLDVHQGNGTASIFRNDRTVFTFSMHQRDLYPEVKEKSSLDVELPAGTGDGAYLEALRANLPGVFEKAGADLAVYNAGVDVYGGDLLGGLKLTEAGIIERDLLVFSECFGRGVPAALALSGGYAAEEGVTARLHANTIEAAVRLYGGAKRRSI